MAGAYRPRIADSKLRSALQGAGAVVVQQQPAWQPHLRSRAALRQAPQPPLL